MKLTVRSVISVALAIACAGCAKRQSTEEMLRDWKHEVITKTRPLSLFPPKYHDAVAAVSASLISEGEDPREFRAEITTADHLTWTFHLWHKSAFAPGEWGALGNPGGRCRNVVYDTRLKKVTRTYYWQ